MKIPYNETDSFNLVVEQELQDRNDDFILERALRSNSTIFSSEELSENYKKEKKIHDDKIVFKSYASKIIVLVVAAFWTLACISLFLNTEPQTQGQSELKLCLILILIFLVIPFSLIEIRKKSYIEIYKNRIQINDISYNWTEIYKIYFISRPSGRGSRNFIILVLDNGLNDKYEITNLLAGFNTTNKIASYIEYFRKFA